MNRHIKKNIKKSGTTRCANFHQTQRTHKSQSKQELYSPTSNFPFALKMGRCHQSQHELRCKLSSAEVIVICTLQKTLLNGNLVCIKESLKLRGGYPSACKGCLFVCFIASDFLTTICHLAIINVCVIIMLSIGNTQISTLLLCFLYLFVELMITMTD